MKVLVIRFSSIGDVTQSMSIPAHIQKKFPQAEIHFLTKIQFRALLENHPAIHKVWTIEPTTSIFELSKKMKLENFTHVYDAHNNLRSLLFRCLIGAPNKLVRPMMRIKRFLLIYFKINLFEKPFSGQRDLLKPLTAWGIPFELPNSKQLFLSQKTQIATDEVIAQYQLRNYTVLAPSAAHALKRWPLKHWANLISLNPHRQFLVLAGPQDFFTSDLNHFPNVVNLTGQTSLEISAGLIEKSENVISNDTGLLHFSEQLQKKTIALMGPAPFGFPSLKTTIILEKNLKCRPCSKHGQGPCTNSFYHECMVSISPDEVQKVYLSL